MNQLKLVIVLLFACVLCFCGCQTTNQQFAHNVNDALDVILPRYNDYVAKDTQFNAEQITAILKSTNELKLMVEEEINR